MPPFDQHGGQVFGLIASISQLKASSMRKLSGRYGVTIGVTLTILASNFLLSGIIGMLIPPNTRVLFCVSEVVIFLATLLMGMLVSGRTYLFMNILYDREAAFADLKQGFTQHPEKAVLMQIPFALTASLAIAPLSYYQTFYYNTPDRQVLFICMLVSTVGFLTELVLELVFSQVYFLLHDFPERRVSELFGASARLMRGQIGRYFLLLLSYVPWLFLSALLFFIPALFILSQMYAAQTAFYQSLTGGEQTLRR